MLLREVVTPQGCPKSYFFAPGFVRSFLCSGPVPQRERAARELLALRSAAKQKASVSRALAFTPPKLRNAIEHENPHIEPSFYLEPPTTFGSSPASARARRALSSRPRRPRAPPGP
jgi:hypothetical protein